MALVLVTGAFAWTGCASNKYGPPTTAWDNDQTPSQGSQASDPAPAKPVEAAKRTAADVASGTSSATSCMENAERIGGDAGVALVRECMHRDDFYDLARAVREPWLPKLRTSTQLQARVVEVIARRGGFLERDARVLARGKLGIVTLDEALDNSGTNGTMKVGQLVLARGTVEKVASEKWGKGKGLVAHIAETSWLETDAPQIEETPSIADVELATPARTGRMFYVRVENAEQLKRAAEVVVLLNVEGPRKGKAADAEAGDAESSLIGILVAASEAAQQLRE